MLIGRRPLLVGRRPLLVGRWPLLVGRRPLLVGRWAGVILAPFNAFWASFVNERLRPGRIGISELNYESSAKVWSETQGGPGGDSLTNTCRLQHILRSSFASCQLMPMATFQSN